VNILVLSKNKTDSEIQFINATGLYEKGVNNNFLSDDHIDRIVKAFGKKRQVHHFCKNVMCHEVEINDYNLSVSSYVEAEDTREVVNIGELNAELKTTVVRIDHLRSEIDAIVAEIEGGELDV